MAGYHSIHNVFEPTTTINAQLGYAGPVGAGTSFATNQTSPAMIYAGNMPMLSFQLKLASAGTLNGTLQVQASDDPLAIDPSTAATAAWVPVQTVTVAAGLIGGNASAMVVVQNGARAYRCVWTNSSGTGTGFVYMTGVGA